MRIMSIVLSVLTIIFLITYIVIRVAVMPVNYIIIKDDNNFDINSVLNIKNEKKDIIFSYDVPAFKEVDSNDKTSIYEINYTNEYLQDIKNISMVSGNFLQAEDINNNSCVITEYTAKIYFGNSNDALGKSIKIGKYDYEIIGIYKSESNSKNIIYIYLNKYREKVPIIKEMYLKIDPKYIYDDQVEEFLRVFKKNKDSVKIKKVR